MTEELAHSRQVRSVQSKPLDIGLRRELGKATRLAQESGTEEGEGSHPLPHDQSNKILLLGRYAADGDHPKRMVSAEANSKFADPNTGPDEPWQVRTLPVWWHAASVQSRKLMPCALSLQLQTSAPADA